MIRNLRGHASAAQGPLREFLRGRGLAEGRTLWMINAVAITVPARLVQRLAEWPGVERLTLDREVAAAPHGFAAAPGFAAPEWNIDRLGAPALWSLGLAGSGVVVGIVDGGVDVAHQDLSLAWRSGPSGWFDPHDQHATPYDAVGHGTAVAGLAVGRGVGGSTIGVAPEARFIAAKIFDDSGNATLSAIHDALQWMLDPDGDPDTDDAADVINNSWGLTDDVGECVTEFEADIQLLEAADIAVVFSAGNSGPTPGSSLSPANNPDALAVGAVNIGDVVAPASSRGPSSCDDAAYPDLVAPGVDVWTADLTLGGTFVDSYQFASGTSFAAPHVAGALALLRQGFADATVGQLEAALLSSAVDLGLEGPDHDTGWGRIDLPAAHAWLVATVCADADADGYRGGGMSCLPFDCDDADVTVWQVPAAVTELHFELDATTLVWTPPFGSGGEPGTLRFDVVRAESPDDFGVQAVCVESDDGTDSQATDTQIPDPGMLFAYVVRAENACSPDPAGSVRSCP